MSTHYALHYPSIQHCERCVFSYDIVFVLAGYNEIVYEDEKKPPTT